MKKSIQFAFAALFVLAILAPAAVAQNVNNYILQSPSQSQAQAACQRYGLTMVSIVRQPDTYLIQITSAVPPSTLQQWVKGDADVKHLELNNKLNVPETAIVTMPYVPPMPTSTYVSGDLAKLYGSTAWVGYVQQPATYQIDPADHNLTGVGIIAVIDTGVDARNPVLAPVVIPGYDFTRNVAGYASDLADINQSTAAILEQSTAAILESKNVVQLNQSTAAILEQSTAAILEGQPVPSHFGHGTMVAGLIHLVAPTAKIMPLKAFSADGTGQTSDIVRAIYYAADNGANVINMSFSMPQNSDALMKAINYAARKNVILIASAGNDGQSAMVYPAALGNVIGVASVNQQNQASSFTNYGPDLVAIAAPGEALVTTYPGAHYAVVWGTSFSSAIVAGAADLMLQATNNNTAIAVQEGDIRRALSHAVTCGEGGSLGAGCMDLNAAVQNIKGLQVPNH